MKYVQTAPLRFWTCFAKYISYVDEKVISSAIPDFDDLVIVRLPW